MTTDALVVAMAGWATAPNDLVGIEESRSIEFKSAVHDDEMPVGSKAG